MQVTTVTLQTLGPCYLRPLDDRHSRISLELLPEFLPNQVDKETPGKLKWRDSLQNEWPGFLKMS